MFRIYIYSFKLIKLKLFLKNNLLELIFYGATYLKLFLKKFEFVYTNILLFNFI